jgi:hypothetical protein
LSQHGFEATGLIGYGAGRSRSAGAWCILAAIPPERSDARIMNFRRTLIIAIVIAGAWVATQISSVVADTAIVTATRDNTLFESPTGALSSGAGPAIFAGNNSTPLIRRALVYFQLAGALPAGAVIDSVELQLYVSSAPNDVPQIAAVHRVLAEWGEGSSVSVGGGGAPATSGDATWLHRFYPNSFWTNTGGDFDPVAHASATIGGVGFYTWDDDLLTSDVRAWWNAPSSNFGWLIVGNESGASTVRRFESRETAVVEQRPWLVVHYSLPTQVAPVTWGRVKDLYPPRP